MMNALAFALKLLSVAILLGGAFAGFILGREPVRQYAGITTYEMVWRTALSWWIPSALLSFTCWESGRIIQKKHLFSNINNDQELLEEEKTVSAIRMYKDLLDDGVITEEEFEEKKKQLLGL